MSWKIGLTDLKIHAPVGVYEWERQKGRDFICDIEITLNKDLNELNDQLAETVDYEQVYAIVNEELQKGGKLIESFLDPINKRIAQLSSNIEEVKIRITKPEPTKSKNFGNAWVEKIFCTV